MSSSRFVFLDVLLWETENTREEESKSGDCVCVVVLAVDEMNE